MHKAGKTRPCCLTLRVRPASREAVTSNMGGTSEYGKAGPLIAPAAHQAASAGASPSSSATISWSPR